MGPRQVYLLSEERTRGGRLYGEGTALVQRRSLSGHTPANLGCSTDDHDPSCDVPPRRQPRLCHR